MSHMDVAINRSALKKKNQTIFFTKGEQQDLKITALTYHVHFSCGIRYKYGIKWYEMLRVNT